MSQSDLSVQELKASIELMESAQRRSDKLMALNDRCSRVVYSIAAAAIILFGINCATPIPPVVWPLLGVQLVAMGLSMRFGRLSMEVLREAMRQVDATLDAIEGKS